MSKSDESGISVEDRDVKPGWHLKALAVIIAVLLVAYVVAVNMVLK